MKVKRAQVIMLPTNNESLIIKCISNFTSNPLEYYRKSTNKNYNYQHLYIVDDSDIKSGDWKLINTDTDKLSTVVQHEKGINYYKQSKIIATTDKSLAFIPKEIPSGIAFELPQPSKSFIEKYVKLGGIDEVNVEYGIDMVLEYSSGTTPSTFLKINSHNEITIHPIKDSWSKDEVNHVLRDFSNVMGLDSSYVRTYIKENI